MAWPRWLGVSIAIHAAVIAGVWVGARTTTPAPSPEFLATAVPVTLVDARDEASPAPMMSPPQPFHSATKTIRHQPAPRIDAVLSEPSPTAIPEPEPTPLNRHDLPEEPSSVVPAPAEAPSRAVAGDAIRDGHGAEEAAHEHYRPLVLGILERAKRYPILAQRRGIEGTVEIVFLIGADGTISDPQIIVPSTHRALDEATLAMLHRIGSLPAPPDQMPLRFPVRIEYKLDSIASPISAEGANP